MQNVQDVDPGDQGGVTDQNVDDQNVDYTPDQGDNLNSVDDNFDGGGSGGDDTSFV